MRPEKTSVYTPRRGSIGQADGGRYARCPVRAQSRQGKAARDRSTYAARPQLHLPGRLNWSASATRRLPVETAGSRSSGPLASRNSTRAAALRTNPFAVATAEFAERTNAASRPRPVVTRPASAAGPMVERPARCSRPFATNVESRLRYRSNPRAGNRCTAPNASTADEASASHRIGRRQNGDKTKSRPRSVSSVWPNARSSPSRESLPGNPGESSNRSGSARCPCRLADA